MFDLSQPITPCRCPFECDIDCVGIRLALTFRPTNRRFYFNWNAKEEEKDEEEESDDEDMCLIDYDSDDDVEMPDAYESDEDDDEDDDDESDDIKEPQEEDVFDWLFGYDERKRQAAFAQLYDLAQEMRDEMPPASHMIAV